MSTWRVYEVVQPPMHGALRLLREYLKIVGPDPRGFGFKIIDVPLDQKPNALWIDCLKHPGIIAPSFQGTEVHDSTIRIKADAQYPERDLGTLEEYVRKANEVYLAKVADIQKREDRRKAAEAKEAEDNRAMQERLRKRA